MKRVLTLSIAAAALMAGGLAYAQPERPDRNVDMTRAQATERADAMFARMDANSDGRLDEADREARARARFDRLDTNKDGSLTFAEMQAGRQDRPERRGMRHHARGQGERGGAMMGPMARHADADSDGAITQAEFRSASLAMFERADANNDGTVTAEERKATHEQMREQMRERRDIPRPTSDDG